MTEAKSSHRNKPLKNGFQRLLRERKQRKLYIEELVIGDEDVEGTRGFSVADKLESIKFAQSGIIKEMNGSDLNVCFIQRFGMNLPLLIRDQTGLGLKMPDPDEFNVNDVRLCVGSRRLVDVMDVNTQKNIQMTMKEWQQYYENPQKERLLNVISLEFSHTRLDQYVQSPDIVRKIDWTDIVWPKQLKDAQRDPTNAIGEMMYPKVQKYCLMSVRNCYTDFHIDFGGTSVWYHILKGSKVFWLIPPTDRNLQLYERWVLSGKQSDVFFGDTVEKCARVYLTAGNTFFIPSGWIHAVYTPEDSLVFGGNFLHSFGIMKQLKTVHVEDCTRVPQKFRYPFFTEMLWYVLARYVHILLGNSHLYGELSYKDEITTRSHIHLTHYELFGLKEIVMYLYDLPPQKKNVPELVRDPVLLIKDVRTLVELHCRDKMEMACTGISVLLPHESQIKWQPYDRTRVKHDIKVEMSLKNTEIVQEQQRIQASHPKDNSSNAVIHSTIASLSNCTMDGHVIQIKKDRTAEITSIQNGLFASPEEFLKHQHPKTLDCENAIELQSNCGDTMSVVSSSTSVGCLAKNNMNSSTTLPTSLNDVCDTPSCSTSFSSNNENSTINEYSAKVLPMTCFGHPRRRRTRCKACAACKRNDCGECTFCLDMIKFGGPGRAKQTCMLRQCLAPMLPLTAQCVHCQLDGWRQVPVLPQTKLLNCQEEPSSLMECSVCYEITHPDCALITLERHEGKGIVCEDLPNSWECPKCCRSGKNNDYKPRHFRARQKSSEVRRMSNSIGESFQENLIAVSYNNDFIYTSESELETSTTGNITVGLRQATKRLHQPIETKDISSSGLVLLESEIELLKMQKNEDKSTRINHQVNIGVNASINYSLETINNSNCTSSSMGNYTSNCLLPLTSVTSMESVCKRKKNSIRSQLAHQMLKSSNRVLKKPIYVVRTTGNPLVYDSHVSNITNKSNLALEPFLLKLIFRHLPPAALVSCCSVCKTWSNVAVDPILWRSMNVSEHKMTAVLLTAIVRRQPEHLVLNWTQIAKRQLIWLLSRLPVLKSLSMQNCSMQAVQALHFCFCPPLQVLDLSFVYGLNDSIIRDILAPPKDSRPGLIDSKPRLRELKAFKLAGTDISDVAMRYITQTLTTLAHLDISSCQRITDAGIAQIGTSVTACTNLVELNLSGCRLVTELSLEHLYKCEKLLCLDLRYVPQVSTQSVIKFAARSKHDLCVKDVKLVEKRRSPSPGYIRDAENTFISSSDALNLDNDWNLTNGEVKSLNRSIIEKELQCSKERND